MSLNKNEIYDRIKTGTPFSISFRYADNEDIMIINGIYAKLLARFDLLYTVNSVITIMREVVANAQKANAKRIYFMEKGLDINNPDEYRTGMKHYKDSVVVDLENFEKLLNGSDHRVEIHFDPGNECLSITVTNTVPVHPEELERINRRIESSYRYNSIVEAYDDIQDSTEGAGLGIALTIVTLKSMGIAPSRFNIASTGGSTAVSLTIPARLKPVEITTKIKDEIISRVEGIPIFPENTLRLLELCDDPGSSMEIIAGEITKDPALSADVQKLSNSAGFVSGNKIEGVLDAVKNLGLQNVKSILMASSARRILLERFKLSGMESFNACHDELKGKWDARPSAGP